MAETSLQHLWDVRVASWDQRRCDVLDMLPLIDDRRLVEAPTAPEHEDTWTPRRPERRRSWLRWAVVLMCLTVIAVLAVATVVNDSPEPASDGLVVFDPTQIEPRVPDGYVPSGWEAPELTLTYTDYVQTARVPPGYIASGWVAPELTLVMFDPAMVSARGPPGYIASGWEAPEITYVLFDRAIEPRLPDGFRPLTGD